MRASPGPRHHASWSMFLAAHRHQIASRRSRHAGDDRALIFARDPKVVRWIEHELFGERLMPHFADSLAEVITLLTLVPPPWPRFLIIEVDAITPFEVALAGCARASGWSGSVIAIGNPSSDLRTSLGIDTILDRSLGCEVLRNVLPARDHLISRRRAAR
jgi:hypothetical protein